VRRKGRYFDSLNLSTEETFYHMKRVNQLLA